MKTATGKYGWAGRERTVTKSHLSAMLGGDDNNMFGAAAAGDVSGVWRLYDDTM